MDRGNCLDRIPLSNQANSRRSSIAVIGLFVLHLNGIAIANDFLFQPAGCDFAITFHATPTLEEYQVPLQTHTCVSHVGMLISADGKSAIKADCTVCPGASRSSPPSEPEIMAMLRESALQSGVEDAIFSYSESPSGPIGVYRGVMKGVGNTFVSVSYFGAHSGLNLVGSAPYTRFHELQFDKFISTLRSSDASGP